MDDPAASPAPMRVLYIDDDAGIRRLASRGLSRRGYDVTVAEGGSEGVIRAATTRFDLIAVDHYMPGMDGLETLRQLNALPDPAPVVYVTGSDEGRIAVAALKAGAADYVVKTVGEDFFDLLDASFATVRTRDEMARARIAAEAELHRSNARLEALLREVNHRVANSLQLVSAMVQLQASALVDPAARGALDDTQHRIQAIAQVHRRLYTSDDVEGVDMRDYLGALVEELGATLSGTAGAGTASGGWSLTLAADPIRLTTDRAVSLGVIVTELVTNACKYAYPDGVGEVRVALVRDSDDGAAGAFTLSVEDDGRGMDPGAAPRGTGLGTKLIRAMAQSLQSMVEYEPRPHGVRAVLRAAVA